MAGTTCLLSLKLKLVGGNTHSNTRRFTKVLEPEAAWLLVKQM